MDRPPYSALLVGGAGPTGEADGGERAGPAWGSARGSPIVTLPTASGDPRALVVQPANPGESFDDIGAIDLGAIAAGDSATRA